jgi:hypothetical protein
VGAVSLALSSLGPVTAATAAVGLADCGSRTGLALVVQGELFLQALSQGGDAVVGGARRVPGIANATAVAAGFLDQGPGLDLVVCVANGTVVLVRDVCNDATRRLEVMWSMPSCGGVGLGDADGNGTVDVFLTPMMPGDLGSALLLNNGSGSFTQALPANNIPPGPAVPVIVDVNGNGAADVPGVGLVDPFPDLGAGVRMVPVHILSRSLTRSQHGATVCAARSDGRPPAMCRVVGGGGGSKSQVLRGALVLITFLSLC